MACICSMAPRVGAKAISSPSLANRPRSMPSQVGRLLAPEKPMTSSLVVKAGPFARDGVPFFLPVSPLLAERFLFCPVAKGGPMLALRPITPGDVRHVRAHRSYGDLQPRLYAE